jgi:soluble lytic murein transglycosylase-like protein
MKSLNRVLLALLFVLPLLVAPENWAQTQTKTPQKKAAAATPATTTQEQNIKAYIELLRADVRQQKAEMMGATMLLSASDAAKFWPIYSDYDAELTKLNDQRVANIEEYARTFDQMTDEKADELIQNAMAYQKQRSELLARTYERVKQALGATTAARFVQVEHQLLLIIDLQIASNLPVIGSGS